MSIHDLIDSLLQTTKIKNFKESLTPKPKPSQHIVSVCRHNAVRLVRVKGRRCLPCKGATLWDSEKIIWTN
jgi:hypothetical protein